jgi:hypothetical protein
VAAKVKVFDLKRFDFLAFFQARLQKFHVMGTEGDRATRRDEAFASYVM